MIHDVVTPAVMSRDEALSLED